MKIELPDGWHWQDYYQPTASRIDCTAQIDATMGGTKFRTMGVVPLAVRDAFYRRVCAIRDEQTTEHPMPMERKGLVTHHAGYAKVTVEVPLTGEQYVRIYGPQPVDDEDEDDGVRYASFTCMFLRVPCHREQITLTVLPGHKPEHTHGGSYLRITGNVDLVEHQGHVHPDIDMLGTTFVYLDLLKLSLSFPPGWTPLT